jgi:hypothetical protein
MSAARRTAGLAPLDGSPSAARPCAQLARLVRSYVRCSQPSLSGPLTCRIVLSVLGVIVLGVCKRQDRQQYQTRPRLGCTASTRTFTCSFTVSECTLCLPGTIAPFAVHLHLCLGFTQATITLLSFSFQGSTACQLCEENSFSSAFGSAACTACSATEVSGSRGATACIKCPPGSSAIRGLCVCDEGTLYLKLAWFIKFFSVRVLLQDSTVLPEVQRAFLLAPAVHLPLCAAWTEKSSTQATRGSTIPKATQARPRSFPARQTAATHLRPAPRTVHHLEATTLFAATANRPTTRKCPGTVSVRPCACLPLSVLSSDSFYSGRLPVCQCRIGVPRAIIELGVRLHYARARARDQRSHQE